MPESNIISSMLALLAGSGFDKIASSISKLSQSGIDLSSLFSLPNMPLMMAGAGVKDVANSMDVVGPMMRMFAPPQPSQQQQQDPNKINAALQMLSARLGPGDSGLRLPAGGTMPQAGMGLPPPLPMAAPMARPPMIGV